MTDASSSSWDADPTRYKPADDDRTETPPEAPVADEAAEHRPQVADYQIVGVLGHGARGVVYQAVDAEGNQVALKVMTELPNMIPAEMQRFLREANASKKLRRHPHIITVYDTGKHGTDRYICMELVPKGWNLKRLMHAETVSLDRALELAVGIADALAFAHDEGVFHRDLKPSNVLINEFGDPLLADFGLAKTLDCDELTLTGEFMGTPRYMSPEQVSRGNKHVGAASDQYSFGVLLYELLTGSFPYPVDAGMGFLEVAETIRDTPPLPPRRLNKEIGTDLEAIVLRLLEKDPKHRYRTMHAVTRDLKAYLQGDRVSARRRTWGERLDRWFWRHRTVLIVISMCSFFGSTFWVWRQWEAGRDQEQQIATALDNVSSQRYEADSRRRLILAQAERELATARGLILVGQVDAAAKRFTELMEAPDLPYPIRQLSRFEAGICYWLSDRQDEAREIWRGVPAPITQTDESVDSRRQKTYFRELNRVMAGDASSERLVDLLPAMDPALAGLGQWVVSYRSPTSEVHEIPEATKQLFTWMNKEIP